MPIAEARRNDEVISLADSQVLRWLDELNNITDADERAKSIKAEIRRIRREPNSPQNKRRVRQLYSQLDDIQYKPDYMCLIIDKEKDYYRACKGFYINGMKYKRLLGTNGGVKSSTIVFISERHIDEICRRIDNGRDMTKELVPAKLEAYKALTCSASIPVSYPNGILVVNDCEVEFNADIVYLNDEDDGEPVMENRCQVPVQVNDSDGYGLMMPSLAERWSRELNLDYIVSGLNSRMSWTKGMIFTFDFVDFAEKVAGSYLVKDAWGNEVDIRSVELILTTSMLKLWDSYKNIEDYLRNCVENHYTFGVTKTCPKELESERNLNYQFIQSYDLDDDQISELIKPTMDEIHDILHGDRMKTILYLKGMGLNQDNIHLLENDFAKAIMIDEGIMDDPYVQSCIYNMIKKRIDDAKVGVLKVHGNYSIICGDPYALCQNIFGLPVTGLLKAGEIYNLYWNNVGSDKLACFRAPMTSHNNIRLVRPHRSEEASYWYRYMTSCTLLNCWDTATHALNGADKDGDLVMLTDNRVLVDNLKELPAIMCVQRRAKKKIVSEADAVAANIASFGDEIGKTTNWITSMFEVQSHFDKDSEEYKTLEYRIMSGQLFQQNAIDKAKGIVAKPMPRYWHDRHSVNQIEDIDEKRFQLRIVADKKPYFMRIIYPTLAKQYNTYIKTANRNSRREFGLSIDELELIPCEDRTDRQNDFIRYYYSRIPVGIGDCVMNKICRRFEKEFDGYLGRYNRDRRFDLSIYRSNEEYTRTEYKEIEKLYNSYCSRIRQYMAYASREHIADEEYVSMFIELRSDFDRMCSIACPNKMTLCNIIIDLCYTKNSTKKMSWDMCGSEMIKNALEKHDYTLQYPTLDQCGDICFCGNRFRIESVRLEEDNGDCIE